MTAMNPSTAISRRAPGEPTRFDPDEIFRRIDALRQSFGPEPSLLEQLLSSSARRHGEAVHSAAISAVKARQVMIDGLAGCIRTFVEVHAGDLKVRGASFVLETFARQSRGLNVIVEETLVGFLETFSSMVARIEAIPNLTEAQKADQIERAYRRAEEGMSASKDRFNTALDELAGQVQSVIREIGA